ncbi:hypothetical protein [Sphingobium chungangianum]
MTNDSGGSDQWTATRLYSRAVIRLSPLDSVEDVTDFLDSVVTSDIRHLPAWTGLLSSKGKALFDFIVWPAGECLLLDCEADAADDLVETSGLSPPPSPDRHRAGRPRSGALAFT